MNGSSFCYFQASFSCFYNQASCCQISNFHLRKCCCRKNEDQSKRVNNLPLGIVMYWSKSTSSSIPKIFFIFGIVWTTYCIESKEEGIMRHTHKKLREIVSRKFKMSTFVTRSRWYALWIYQPPLNIANWKVCHSPYRLDLKITYLDGVFNLPPLLVNKQMNIAI